MPPSPQIKEKWGKIDFLVHSIAFAGKEELMGSMVANTSREGFRRAMDISVYSFIDCARRASEIMPDGGSIICMTYLGAERTVPSYNVMGVAKAALEASTRYAARDLGAKGIRVNAISAGAMRTLSLAGIRGGKGLMSTGRDWSLLKEDTSMEGVAGCALYLLSPIGRSITGEVVHVDAGFHIVGVPEISEGGAAQSAATQLFQVGDGNGVLVIQHALHGCLHHRAIRRDHHHQGDSSDTDDNRGA